MQSQQDPFLRVALPYILGIVVGFSLVLMGFILLALAGLTTLTETNETPSWVWLLLGVVSEGLGIYMMYKLLRSSPTPGTFGPGSSK